MAPLSGPKHGSDRGRIRGRGRVHISGLSARTTPSTCGFSDDVSSATWRVRSAADVGDGRALGEV